MSSNEKGYGGIPNGDLGISIPEARPTEPSLQRQCIAEAFGTCVLVQVGCAGLCATVYIHAFSGLWQAAVVWLIAGALAVSATASISGAHLNPAITLSFALVRPNDFPFRKVVPYWIAQLVGAFTAGLINLAIFHTAILNFEQTGGILRGTESGVSSATAFGDYYMLSNNVGSWYQALFIEGFGTAFLVFIIFSVTHPSNDAVPSSAVPLIVGTSIAAMVATLGSLTGSGINPARDFGPRLVTSIFGWGSASFQGALVYIVGPLIGGPIGAFFADKVLRD